MGPSPHDRLRRLPAPHRARRAPRAARRARAARAPQAARAAVALRRRAHRRARRRPPRRDRAGARDASTPPPRASGSMRPRSTPSAATTSATRCACWRPATRPPCCTSRATPAVWRCSPPATRRPSRSSARGAPAPTALQVAHALGRGLAAAGVTVISGMALGIDSAAHAGALEVGGPTITVLAGGADVAYPASKRSLHRELVRTQAAISEMPPGFKPFRWCFPARNRTIAGLASLTIVVEATERSGSLITADLAQELGRAVGAVPGPVTARALRGIQRPAARRRARHPPRPGRAGRGARHRRGDRAHRPPRPRSSSRRCAGCCAAWRTAATPSRRSRPRRRRRSTRSRASASSSCWASCGAAREDAMCACCSATAAGGAYPRAHRPSPPPRPRRALDRRLGFRRRGGDPGRSEGLRARRRPRHDGDHGDHGAEHRRGLGRAADRPGDHHRPDPRGRRGPRHRRGEDRDARRRRDDRDRRAGARRAAARHARSSTTR